MPKSNKKQWWSKAFDKEKSLSCVTCLARLDEGVCSKRQWHMGTEDPPRGRCYECIRQDPFWTAGTPLPARGMEEEKEERLVTAEIDCVDEAERKSLGGQRTAAVWLEAAAMEKASGSERGKESSGKLDGKENQPRRTAASPQHHSPSQHQASVPPLQQSKARATTASGPEERRVESGTECFALSGARRLRGSAEAAACLDNQAGRATGIGARYIRVTEGQDAQPGAREVTAREVEPEDPHHGASGLLRASGLQL